MSHIKLGETRLTIDVHRLFRTDDGLWRFTFARGQSEVVVLLAGDRTAPDSAWLKLAQRVAADLHPFLDAAIEYLKCYVAESKLETRGAWDVERLEFGCAPSRWPESFELILHHSGDPQANYGVRFFHGPAGFRANEFRRFELG
jgi:hypothetical protein